MFDSTYGEGLLDAAVSFGADAAEVYIARRQETDIIVSGGKPDSVCVRSDDGFALRILVKSRMAFASSNLSDRKKAIDMVRDTVERASHNSSDEYNTVPNLNDTAAVKVREVYDEKLETIPLSRKIDKVLQVESTALRADPRVKGFGWLQYGDSVQEYCVCNTNGIRSNSRGSIAYVFAYSIASDGECVQTGTLVEATGSFDGLDSNMIGRKAADFALRMLGASDMPSGEYRLLLPPETGHAFLAAFADLISADKIQKGKSPLRDRLGDFVAAECVTIVDDGTLEGGLGTTPVDGEGVPTQRTVLVEKGILKGYLHDSYSAKKGRCSSTGNSCRSGYHSLPRITPSNFFLEPGSVSADSLVKDCSEGVYVTEVSGLHAGINPTTADFSVPAKGIMIINGELTQPVDNITISGNLLNFFGNVDGIANDMAWTPALGVIGIPTVSVSQIKLTGRS